MGRRARQWPVWAGGLALAAVVALLVMRPAAPLSLAAAPGQPPLWRGAYHVHSTRSDGSGTPDEIARAAAAAGLQFVILTDHGDATRTPDPPRHVGDVLVIDGVEISTDDGHFVALGLPQAPYPLAGEGRAVEDDVRRLGGIGILAHPDSPRPALAWHDASVRGDGFEWVNADSAWRGAPSSEVVTGLLTYLGRPSASLSAVTRHPEALLAAQDTPDARPAIAIAAVDAHARIGWKREADPLEGGRTLARFPSYAASFGTFGIMVPWLDGPPTGDAARDAHAILGAIRSRIAYAAVFSMANPVWLDLELLEPVDTATPGPDARGPAALTVRSNAPAGTELRVRRNGRPWRELTPSDPSVRLEAHEAPAVYRAELWLPARRGWPALPVALSAARAHNLAIAPPVVEPAAQPDGTQLAARRAGRAVEVRSWHVEHDPRSTAALVPAPDAVASASLALAAGDRVSQFAALVADLAPMPPDATGLELQLAADAPMRLSVQFREPRPGEGLRWRHSAYVDPTRRVVELPIAAFRPIRPAGGTVPPGVHALLFVMDTVNARPGDRRTLTVHGVRWTTGR